MWWKKGDYISLEKIVFVLEKQNKQMHCPKKAQSIIIQIKVKVAFYFERKKIGGAQNPSEIQCEVSTLSD